MSDRRAPANDEGTDLPKRHFLADSAAKCTPVQVGISVETPAGHASALRPFQPDQEGCREQT